MPRVLARRTVQGLIPADTDAGAEFARVPAGRVCYVEIVRARNPKQHRLLMVLFQMLVENDIFPSIDAAMTAVKIATGHVDVSVTAQDLDYADGEGELHRLRAGAPIFTPKSISFANMGQSDFEAFFDAACKVIAERWITSVSDAELRDIVRERAG